MPFGLTNAPSTFQQLMQSVLRCLESFSLPYIDDIIIYSTSFSDHLSHIITAVLSRLSTAGLTVKQSKCSWCFESFDFLGFHVGRGKLHISSIRVSHFTNYVLPTTKSSLRSFLGFVMFYSRFIPRLSSFTTFLNSHLTKNSPDHIQHDDDSITALKSIISSVSHHVSLVIPNVTDSLCVFTDASYKGMPLVECYVSLGTNRGCHVVSTPANCYPGKGIILSWIWKQQPCLLSSDTSFLFFRTIFQSFRRPFSTHKHLRWPTPVRQIITMEKSSSIL